MVDDWSLVDIANPCMKCGSVQCAICSKDLDILRQKIISDICEELVFPESKIITEIINKRFGVE
jgi:hypothetical protein